MKRLVDKYGERITGTISCFDRLLFKGYLPLTWPKAMEKLIARNGLKIKDFKNFVQSCSQRLKDHAKTVAEKSGRSFGAAVEFHQVGFFKARQRICDHLRESA